MKKTVLGLSLFLMVSCAHSIKKNLNLIEAGMTRSEVVDLLGSPIYVDRNNVEKHVWDYRFYDEESKSWQMKSVVFVKDVVTEVSETKEREVVFKNVEREPVYEEYKAAEKEKLEKREKAISNEDWLEQLDRLQKESQQKERAKSLQEFKPIR